MSTYDDSMNLSKDDIKFKRGELVYTANYDFNDWEHCDGDGNTTKIIGLSTSVETLTVSSVMSRKVWRGSNNRICKVTVRDEYSGRTILHAAAVVELAKSPEGALRKLITRLNGKVDDFEKRLKSYKKTPYDPDDALSWTPDECELYIKTYKRLITLANRRISSVKKKRIKDKELERKRREFSKTWKNRPK